MTRHPVSTLQPEDLRAGVASAEVVVVNEYEFSLLCNRTGLSADDIRNTVPILIQTRGDKGSFYNRHED